jgi:hypothetical protein
MATYLSNLVAAGPDHSSALSSDLGEGLLLIVKRQVHKWKVRLAELCACYTAWNARQSPRERRPRCVIDKVELTPRDARDDRVGARAWYESTTLHAGLYNGTFDHLRLEDDQHWTWRTLRLVLLAPMFVSRTLYCCLTSKVLFMSTTASVDPIGPRLMTRYPTTRSTKYCSFEHREH